MHKDTKRIAGIFARYLALILLAMGNLWIFYKIFTPLTIYPVYFLLNLLYHASLSGTSIFSSQFSIQLVNACIAGSAYYLLLILNLAVSMPLKKRIPALIFSFLAFLIINILRIFLFTLLLVKSPALFNFSHLAFWYILSAVIVFLVWLLEIKLFKIKAIPFYDDLKFLYNKAKTINTGRRKR